MATSRASSKSKASKKAGSGSKAAKASAAGKQAAKKLSAAAKPTAKKAAAKVKRAVGRATIMAKKAGQKLKSKVKSLTAAKPTRAKPAAAQPAYHTLTPFLNIKGAAEAIEFYKRAFGAKERMRMPGPDGQVMHAELVIGDSVLMLADVSHMPASRSNLHLYVDDCDAQFARALAEGAVERMALQDQFWGDRYGQVEDPYGIIWSIATQIEEVSAEEMQRRMAAMPPPGGEATATKASALDEGDDADYAEAEIVASDEDEDEDDDETHAASGAGARSNETELV